MFFIEGKGIRQIYENGGNYYTFVSGGSFLPADELTNNLISWGGKNVLTSPSAPDDCNYQAASKLPLSVNFYNDNSGAVRLTGLICEYTPASGFSNHDGAVINLVVTQIGPKRNGSAKLNITPSTYSHKYGLGTYRITILDNNGYEYYITLTLG